MKTKKDDYISLKTVKLRGWTQGLISKFLKEPDKIVENPIYKCASPMKLYLLKRVVRKEKTKTFMAQFDKMKNKRAILSEKGKERADKMRIELFTYIDNLNIIIPLFPRDSLYKKSVAHYNKLWEYDISGRFANVNDDETFLNRITVNYLRHNYNGYEEKLDKLFGKVGRDEGYIKIKLRILEKISQTYDFLSDECLRQSEEATMKSDII